MGSTINPNDDWFMNPLNPASPLHPLMFPNDDDFDHDYDEEKEVHMDSGSQFDRTNWTTTGMDSDYEKIDPSTSGGTTIEYEPLKFPQATWQ